MTLIITSYSDKGIVMVGESKIIFIGSKKEKEWKKVFTVSKIKAGISYWGQIGLITKRDFPLWLKEKIDNEDRYTDLESFGNYIVSCLNKECNNKILKEDIGFHLAGYSEWQDGVERPCFYHIHNGHGMYVNSKWKSQNRKLFELHKDFPDLGRPIKENLDHLASLKNHTRNGDFIFFAGIEQKIWAEVDKYNINNQKTFNSLSSLMNYWHNILKIMILLYKIIGKDTIGGDVNTLGINENGFISGF